MVKVVSYIGQEDVSALITVTEQVEDDLFDRVAEQTRQLMRNRLKWPVRYMLIDAGWEQIHNLVQT